MNALLRYVFCLVIMLLQFEAVAYDNRPIVVLREDDGWTNCRTIYAEFGNKSFLQFAKDLNMPITWGVITSRANIGGNSALSWAEHIDYIANAGGELASHSASHVPMSSMQAYIDDLLLSKNEIEANTPYPCKTFLQPGTWTGEAFFLTEPQLSNPLGQAIKNNFAQSQMYLGNTGIAAPVYRHGQSANIGIDYNYHPAWTDFLKTMEYIAHTPGGMYVIQFHGIQSSTGTADYNTRADFMAALLVKLDQLRNDGSIRLLSINDAYNNNHFSPDVNRMFDPGFEYTSPELAKYSCIWTSNASNTIAGQIGYNNSKCARLVSGDYVQQEFLTPSGKYKMSWMQKPDDGTTLDKAVSPRFSPMTPWTDSVFSPKYSNSTNEWEQKSLLFKVPNAGRARFKFSSTGAFLIDNVSLQLIDPLPSECVINLKITAVPTGINISWRSPDNTAYNKIILRYSLSAQCPQTTSEGNLIQQVTAQNGNTQTLFYPFNWSGKYYIYVSAFAVKADGTYSEPDVDYLSVDSSKPLVSINPITRQGKDVNISWKSTTNVSAIYTNSYAVGSAPNTTNIIGWTENNGCSVHLNSLQPGNHYYFSAKSQNIFGIWSDVASLSFLTEASNVAHIFKLQDGDSCVAAGDISAIFGESYYIQSVASMRGIRVVGPTNSLALGTSVTVEGVMKTSAGERYLHVLGTP